MKMLSITLALLVSGISVHAQAKRNVEAYSRVHHHKDGSRTESRKDGDKREIHELTYNKNEILAYKRMFITDSRGRIRQGVIFDGKGNPLGSIAFGYSAVTDQLMEERQFNKDGKLIRKLFYPGSLKDPKFANRFVAFNFDPNNEKAKPVQETRQVQPTRPVESDQEEFQPGIPIGNAAPAANAAPVSPPAPAPAPVATAPAERRSFLKRRSGARN